MNHILLNLTSAVSINPIGRNLFALRALLKRRLLNKMASLTCLLFVILFNSSAYAQLKSIDVGLKAGSKAPQLSVLNSQGQKTTLEQLAGDKGLILVFYRSADWCPYCKRHLIELNQFADKFSALGYGQAAISYDSVDIIKTFAAQKQIKFPLLSDQGAKTMAAYQVLHPRYKPDSDDYGIPYPGLMVINAQGDIVYTYFYQGYKKRVKFEELYKQLAK